MRIGFSSWAFGWAIGTKGYPPPGKPMHADDLVRCAITHGATVIQIADNMPSSETEIITAANLAADHHIEFELGITGTDEAHLIQSIQLANRTGARILRALPHNGEDIPSVNGLISRINSITALLDEYDVTLAIENHDYYTASELRNVMEAVGHGRVGICLDTVNNYGRGESYRETTTKLLPYVKNFHYKDFRITRVPRQTGFIITGAPVGGGLVDINYFKRVLPKSVNWIIEQWTPWQGDIEKTVALEREWATSGLAELFNS